MNIARAIALLTLALMVATLSPSAWAQSGADAARVSTFAVRGAGAVGDGLAKDTAAVQRAIDACAGAGGGTVYFAPGTYLCGSLHLRTGVTLWLDAGATLKGSPDDGDYDPEEKLDFRTDSGSESTAFHHALIGGENVERVGIVGSGTIDGNRAKRGGPKPIALKQCRFVTIRDVTIANSPTTASACSARTTYSSTASTS